MRLHSALSLLAIMALSRGGTPTVRGRPAIPVVQSNANVERAGVLRDSVLSVTLEATESRWYANGTARAPMSIPAFSVAGEPPRLPGPLVRAPAGRAIRFSIRNTLSKPLIFLVPAVAPGGTGSTPAVDSTIIAPGTVGTLTVHYGVAGNYLYRARIPGRSGAFFGFSGLLAGALVIDSAGPPPRARDRVFVIMQTPDSAFAACADTAARNPARECSDTRDVFTINGRSWPSTERVHANVGDSLHWRILNATHDVHPMHLHGFYYRVDRFQTLRRASEQPPAPGQMVVTQLMSPFSTMSMTWSPDRPGDWLFHCHFAIHLQPDSLSAAADDAYLRDMSGLVIGTIVNGRQGVVAAGEPASRHLRLVAEADGPSREERGRLESPDSVPAMHFVLEENGRRVEGGGDFSPELDLVRGEPVAITIVNHLALPTSIHWHGIEVEDSYMDGVPGFSGSGTRLTPAIAPGDSFVARFAPPRAGSFMYHAHVDDAREQVAGLEGALIVRAAGAPRSVDDHVVFLKGYQGMRRHPVEINGRADPDTIVLHAGRPARFRIMNLSTVNPSPQVWLTARRDSATVLSADSLLVSWRLIAKDGFDAADALRMPQRAMRVVADGETYDFEYTPQHPGALRLEFRSNNPQHVLVIRVPLRVDP